MADKAAHETRKGEDAPTRLTCCRTEIIGSLPRPFRAPTANLPQINPDPNLHKGADAPATAPEKYSIVFYICCQSIGTRRQNEGAILPLGIGSAEGGGRGYKSVDLSVMRCVATKCKGLLLHPAQTDQAPRFLEKPEQGRTNQLHCGRCKQRLCAVADNGVASWRMVLDTQPRQCSPGGIRGRTEAFHVA